MITNTAVDQYIPNSYGISTIPGLGTLNINPANLNCAQQLT